MAAFLFGGSVKQLQLLGTSACHLCECAEQLLAALLAAGYAWEIELLDIVEDDALLAQYGERIPVLRDVTGAAELNWPFDAAQVLAFLGET